MKNRSSYDNLMTRAQLALNEQVQHTLLYHIGKSIQPILKPEELIASKLKELKINVRLVSVESDPKSGFNRFGYRVTQSGTQMFPDLEIVIDHHPRISTPELGIISP